MNSKVLRSLGDRRFRSRIETFPNEFFFPSAEPAIPLWNNRTMKGLVCSNFRFGAHLLKYNCIWEQPEHAKLLLEFQNRRGRTQLQPIHRQLLSEVSSYTESDSFDGSLAASSDRSRSISQRNGGVPLRYALGRP